MSGRSGSRRRPWRTIGVGVVLAAFAYVLYGLGAEVVPYLTPSELLAQGDAAYEKPVRLIGQVMPGSVHWDAEALDLRFRMTDGVETLEVHAKRAPPQMFRGGIGVVVEGRYGRGGVFESTNVLVKHSNEYRPPPEGHAPEDLYRTLLPEEAR